jgi:hypothetical protein
MKHLKKYENFKSINLSIKFNDFDEYLKAIEFFNSKSNFSAENTNSEFKTISFSCTDQDDANLTEKEIETELINNNFENYYFEGDSN